ncbi:hypothetical protein [Amycolatopsis sp. cmx-8-4]|uniref:hypothetical protein n=1 Tax=Amycolatopsis sp. cmx-8-4 TaxID=2790947 RepID=UPI00397DE198
MNGDADIARTAALFADPARIRVPLGDGRALATSVPAAEARLSAQGVSAHLAKLRAAGLVRRHLGAAGPGRTGHRGR